MEILLMKRLGINRFLAISYPDFTLYTIGNSHKGQEKS